MIGCPVNSASQYTRHEAQQKPGKLHPCLTLHTPGALHPDHKRDTERYEQEYASQLGKQADRKGVLTCWSASAHGRFHED